MRILQISPHTTLAPRHGGQVRSHHIGRILEAAGFDVKRLAVAARSPNDLPDPREPLIDLSASAIFRKGVVGKPRALYDLLAHRAVVEDRHLLRAFEAAVEEARPDVVMLEHPWLWPALRQMRPFLSGQIQVVYNSHNVEADLRRQLFASVPGSADAVLIGEIQGLEKDLVQSSAATTACTAPDGKIYLDWGAKRVVVANNGATAPQRDHLIGHVPVPLTPLHAYALFVGSDFPPNVAGLQQFIAPLLQFLRPLHRIVIAGGAGPPFSAWLADQHLSPLVTDRLVIMGQVEPMCLDSLIVNASAILLPIPYGGGSNIKTAEALLSWRRVVATSCAMRGFEDYLDIPGLAVADDAARFHAALMSAMESAAYPRRDEALRNGLLWENTLAPLVDLFREMESGMVRPASP